MYGGLCRSVMSLLSTILLSTSQPLLAPPASSSVVGSISPYFALDFSRYLSVNGKRQSVMKAGMSRQMGKRKED